MGRAGPAKKNRRSLLGDFFFVHGAARAGERKKFRGIHKREKKIGWSTKKKAEDVRTKKYGVRKKNLSRKCNGLHSSPVEEKWRSQHLLPACGLASSVTCGWVEKGKQRRSPSLISSLFFILILAKGISLCFCFSR